MVLDQHTGIDLAAITDPTTGTVDRRIFSDEAIYRLEMERIFARAWQFMCHDSQIPNVGDYFMTTIGEDRVIVVRDEDGQPQVLLNSCRHRGNALCRAEEGNASSFMCTYHGWTYDLKGKLVGVPGFKEVYHEALDRENWGLITAAQVDSYKGFIFATMDPEAPSLYDYLGETGRVGINLVAAQGTISIIPGIQKYTIPCNWKLAVDNVWDWYHVQTSHASSLRAGFLSRRPPEGGSAPPNDLVRPQLVMLGDYGHGISGPKHTPELGRELANNPAFDESWRERPEAQAALGPVGLESRGHPHIFPNMWISGTRQISMRFPKGPHATEIWWFSTVVEESDPARRKAQVSRANHVFGPSGMLEQDDGENWAESTKGAHGVISSRYPLNYAMSLGHGVIEKDELGPPRIDALVNEHAQLWLYRAYPEWLLAESWAELKAHHSKPEGTV